VKNKFAGIEPVPMAECKRRCLDFGKDQNFLLPASEFAGAIWPDHRMTPQGAGAAASRVLKALEREGRAGWRPHYERSESRTRWGWWAR